jgi:type VI secretion system protein VasJ
VAEVPLAPFTTPVSADAPAGEDLTYDEAYQRVREEVDRMGTVSVHVDHEHGTGGGGGEVDFDEIAGEARTLLTERTRDLQLAAYMTIALSRSRGAEGLAEGIETTLALARTFGEVVHPLKPVRRRNALQFLSDRLKDWLPDQPFSDSDTEALERAAAATEALQAWTTETMGENAPALSGLRQSLDDALKRASRAARAAETAGAARAATAAGESPEGGSAPAGALVLASAGDARNAVFRICAFLREADATSGVPYRLARSMVWGGLNAEPPSQDGRTQLEGPDAATRAQLGAVSAGGNPVAVLGAAEQAFPVRPFWLDLQRMASQAAAQAGHAGIVRAIETATAELLDRVPGLPGLAFADGSPFADGDTQLWLQALSPGRSADAQPTAAGDDPLAEVLDEARTLAAKGDLDAAVRALQEAPAGRADGRARLRRDLHAARLCVQGGRATVAAALVAGLAEEADRRSLDEWEPALALELWRTAHAAWSAAAAAAADGTKDDALRRAGDAFARLCRLDPAAALGMTRADKKGARG